MKKRMDRISNENVNTTTVVGVAKVTTAKRLNTIGDSSSISKQPPQRLVEDIILEDSNTVGGVCSSSTK